MKSPTTSVHPRKGPWTHRFLVLVLSFTLTLLVYWLLGFLLRDIGALPGPDWNELERKHLDAALVEQQRELDGQLKSIRDRIEDQQTRQSVLRDSVANTQKTIEQLSDVLRLGIEKGVALPQSEQTALAEARALFLLSQQKYQTLNDDIAKLKETEIQAENEKKTVDDTLDAQRALARKELSALQAKHNLVVASFKLIFLIPLALGVSWIFMKKRATVYRPLIYASGIAVYWKLGLVIHEHFPSRFFKYALILVALGIVLKTLVYLLRMIVAPKRDWLLRQYREAYEKFLCPICAYPIRRGPLKYLFWTSRSLKKMAFPQTSEPIRDEPYTCPCCATTLFEKCGDCESVRPALLPACDHCGAEKESEVTHNDA